MAVDFPSMVAPTTWASRTIGKSGSCWVRYYIDTKPTATLKIQEEGQPVILVDSNTSVLSERAMNSLLALKVPIPTTGSGAGKIVARNTNNDGWEFVSSTGSSSSLLIDAHTNATSTATKTGQTIGTGIF